MGEEKLTSHDLIELDEDEQKVLTYIEEKGKASTKELESIMNKSKSTVEKKNEETCRKEIPYLARKEPAGPIWIL